MQGSLAKEMITSLTERGGKEGGGVGTIGAAQSSKKSDKCQNEGGRVKGSNGKQGGSSHLSWKVVNENERKRHLF